MCLKRLRDVFYCAHLQKPSSRPEPYSRRVTVKPYSGRDHRAGDVFALGVQGLTEGDHSLSPLCGGEPDGHGQERKKTGKQNPLSRGPAAPPPKTDSSSP